MTKKKEPKVLIEIDNIRVLDYDDQNVKLERFEEVTDHKTKITGKKWRFVGYYRTIRAALESVINKELLLNKNEITNIKEYVNEVRWANSMVLKALEVRTNE